ncbi:MAG: M28 family peptidase [Myxococcota bacterium]
MRTLPLWLLAACATEPAFDPNQCFSELATALSTDAMDGRGIGTPGLDAAATLIEQRFTDAGLGDVGVGYRQPFTAVTGVALGDENTLADQGAPLALGADFTPLGFTTDGMFSGDVVFVGYGIVAPELGYDDYAGIDVKDRVVLALRYEPGETDPSSPFDGKKASRYSDLRYKAMKAREAGAAALILVAPAREADEPDKLPPLTRGGPTSRAGLPVLQVTRAVADRWLASSGRTVATAAAATAPASIHLPSLSVTGNADVRATEAEARNVVALIPGAGALAGETVVLGAHYDHLGHGGEGAMDPDSTAIHNGADDNASGTAAMVCAMTALAKSTAPSRRSILGIAFSAEEIGLGGSQHYVDHPLRPLEDTVAMVNLDMVGRVVDDKLAALGADTAPEWDELLAASSAPVGLKVDGSGDGYGPSDQTSFFEHQVPVVHLFSGAHADYHTATDDADKLNLAGGGKVTAMVADLVDRVATREQRPTYVRSDTGPRNTGDSRGYGAYLGTVPDFTAMNQESGGVKLQDVRDGGPAARAGVKAGDVLVGLAGAEVQNLYDMSFLLQDHKPGETVEVVVLRDGQRVALKATLGRRGDTGGSAGASATNPVEHVDTFSVGADPAPPGSSQGDWVPMAGKAVPELIRPDERHFADLRQLTFGGENAEAYWGPDGHHVMFQRTPAPGKSCDAEYTLDLGTGAVTRISSGKGRTTCGYYAYPNGERFVYASTMAGGGDDKCPPEPDRSQGYVWPLYETYDLVWHTPGSEPVPFLASPGYDAEATACMKDGRLVFTSVRDGDLELYVVNADGSGLERITTTPGYDGGAFFNPACTALIWRASRPEGKDLEDYQALLAQDLVRPSSLEIFWMDLATRKPEQLTHNGQANFAPYPLPDDSGALYSSNAGASPREFDIYLAKRAGGEPERITTTDGFDGFPMFSPDGRWLVFASNRATPKGQSDTNLFVARWVP